MITRSNLAEQLREYQIRSKHDWASVSFFSSTSNFSSSRSSNTIVKVRCRGLCHMGTSDLSIPGVFSSILVLQAAGTRIHPGLCQLTITCLYENHKASETSQEEEAKDASSSLYVKTGHFEHFSKPFIFSRSQTQLFPGTNSYPYASMKMKFRRRLTLGRIAALSIEEERPDLS
ncbi:unnamed protein product [Thlaspi arvense]|uniref:Uncharacterized protein n=1 Tax=Thlaspi arvense TaxID=13288 RepID=A0AAU9SJI4_THLAR|nr:unnamed protein product [Thlaspi arvense]